MFILNKELIQQLTWREVLIRYKGSYLGVLWSFLTPMLMLIVYTFVYSQIFKSRWPDQSDNTMQFALIIFAGLSTFNIFAEVVSRAPMLIINNVNYVKKVVFPLEILPITVLGSALVQGGISLFILLLGNLITQQSISWTYLLIPLILVPLVLLALGLGWLLSALGVYFRDVGQIIGVFIQALMLLTPIFYSADAVPDSLKFLYVGNPLSSIVENMRLVAVFAKQPDWNMFSSNMIVGFAIFFVGYFVFKRTKGGFADVL
ncbi:ABC transporter permease [Cohnella sp. CBP 2801]|uniref:Transport permease protein n=2 Tax=Cohnella zeiphila TaxID=2761120 RepID=A0A7X0SNU3_9BACL|nr:ABC transporter permease [Cohnella zeiphila]MBB6732284.1 ABC transporter permease [Cohnella zeiphila]